MRKNRHACYKAEKQVIPSFSPDHVILQLPHGGFTIDFDYNGR